MDSPYAGGNMRVKRLVIAGGSEDVRKTDVLSGRLRTLARVNHVISSSLQLDEVLRAIAEGACELMSARSSAVWVADGAARALHLHAWWDHGGSGDMPVRTLRYGEGASGWVAETRQLLLIADVRADARYATREWADRRDLVSYLGVPVRFEGDLLAVLTASGPAPFTLGPDDHDVLEAFVAHAAVAIHHARLYEQVRRARDFLQSIAEHSADAIVTTDIEGRITYVSAAGEELIGAPASKMIGRLITDVEGRWIDAAVRWPAIERAIRAGERITYNEGTVRRADGASAHVTMSIAPMRDVAGTIVGAVAVVRDATEQHQTQAALRQAEKLAFMGSLLAGVAHELNNPLSVLLGQAELLRSSSIGRQDPTLSRRTASILQAAGRCARIVKTFLALARRRTPERRPVSLNDVVTEALELLSYSLSTDSVALTLALSYELPPLSADRHALHQLVVNLVSNAHQALRSSHGARRIIVRTRYDADAGSIVLEIADSGPGVPEAIRESIFEPFFTTKPSGEGTGLGLSLCHSVVTEHGGVILVSASAEGGALFTIRLPVGAAVDPGLADEPASAPRPLPRLRILVVDDHDEARAIVHDLLVAQGHEVHQAVNGADALGRILEGPFDLVLCDVRMPVLDGPGFFRELHRLDARLARRIVFLTGDALTPETSRFLAQVSVPSLQKPFGFAELDAVMRDLLAGEDPAGTS